MFVILAIGLTVFFLMAQYVQPLIYGYRLSAEGIEFVLFRVIRVWMVRFADIDAIREFPLWGLFFGSNARVALYLRNRIFGRNVLLHRRHGLIRRIVITPSGSAAFVRSVSDHIVGSSAFGTVKP